MRENMHVIGSGGLERPLPSPPSEAEVGDLLQRLTHALLSGDGSDAASLWATPAFVIGDQLVQSVHAPEEIAALLGAAREQYSRNGVAATRADVQSMDWIGNRLVLVRVRWPWLDAQQREVGGETSTYLLRRDETGALKLRVVMMHGAEAHAADASPHGRALS